MCSHCRMDEPTVRAGQVRVAGDMPTVGVMQEHPRPGWFVARYPGQCRSCGEPFTAGTHITGTDGSDGWTAECCADEDGDAA